MILFIKSLYSMNLSFIIKLSNLNGVKPCLKKLEHQNMATDEIVKEIVLRKKLISQISVFY